MSLLNYKRRAEGVHFEGETFEKMDLRSMKAFGSTWKDCTFRDCQMDLTDWRASKFEGCLFVRCSLPLVNFATCVFESTGFNQCNLEQASFLGSHLTEVTFYGCRMAYGDTMFQDATCKGEGLLFIDCNLHGSNLDFREVGKGALRFEGCDLWGAKTSFSCHFWLGAFDERTCQRFVALVARNYPNEEVRSRLIEIAGREFGVIDRAMVGRKHEHGAEGPDKPERREVVNVLVPRQHPEGPAGSVLDVDDKDSLPTVSRKREGAPLSSSGISRGSRDEPAGARPLVPEPEVRKPPASRVGLSPGELSQRAQPESVQDDVQARASLRFGIISGERETIPALRKVPKDRLCSPDLTTSREITSKPPQNSPAPTVTTASAVNPWKMMTTTRTEGCL